MRFEALQARYGDSLLLSFAGEGSRPLRLLVDGGPSDVYRRSLKPRLEKERLAFQDEKPLTIDAVMISHVDEDHVQGILDLFDDLLAARSDQRPPLCQPRWLLHNSFDMLMDEPNGAVARALGGETVLASFGTAGPMGLGGQVDPDAIKVLQSYAQGSRLTSLAAALDITRNPPDQTVIALPVAASARVLRIGEARLTVVGPMQKEIAALRTKWLAWQKADLKKKGDQKATAALAAYLDKSVPNLSSLVVLVQEGERTALLTGDARGDKVLKGLEESGLLGKGESMKVDILKLPHHGSVRNVADKFFDRIHADHYIASGDGTYGNPDRETLLMLERCRPQGGFTVHLTYPAASCDETHKQWRARKSDPKEHYQPKRDAIADVVERWRDEKRITIKEGPVDFQV